MLKEIASVIDLLNGWVLWGPLGTAAILGIGIRLTVGCSFFQIRRLPHILKSTVGSLLRKEKDTDCGGISPLQTVSTTLAATIGTGNIAGVAVAVATGGAGSVFWMWVSGILGMMTAYGENFLAASYRKRDKNGAPLGGAMYYLSEGLRGKRYLGRSARPLALAFSLLLTAASLGMGNAVQVSTLSEVMRRGIFGIRLTPDLTGLLVALLMAVTLFKGADAICRITEKLVPPMAFFYLVGCLLVVGLNFSRLGEVLWDIFASALCPKALVGGVGGYTLGAALSSGIKRGVFSNEAGLGTLSVAAGVSSIKSPVLQGMWGSFAVFFDTMVGCTLTALALLTSGVTPSGISATAVIEAFSVGIAPLAGELTALITLLFALSTLLGWAFYGLQGVKYLRLKGGAAIYKLICVGVVIPAATCGADAVWLAADTINGLMAIPNLIGVYALSNEIIEKTNNHFRQKAQIKKQ